MSINLMMDEYALIVLIICIKRKLLNHGHVRELPINVKHDTLSVRY